MWWSFESVLMPRYLSLHCRPVGYSTSCMVSYGLYHSRLMSSRNGEFAIAIANLSKHNLTISAICFTLLCSGTELLPAQKNPSSHPARTASV